ncbi:MAG: hypothetical protein R3B70_22345 [Polyangiaceae bacterium]
MEAVARCGGVSWIAGALSLACAAGGCSSPPPPADPTTDPPKVEQKEPDPEPMEIPVDPVESGKDCAKATSQCAGGVCEVTLDNTCDAPVTCSLAMVTVCQAQTSLVQAKGTTRDTIPAATKTKMALSANCNDGRIVSTRVETLECK